MRGESLAVLATIGICAAYLAWARRSAPPGGAMLPFAPAFALIAVGIALGLIASGDADLTGIAAWVAAVAVATVAADVAVRPAGPQAVLAIGAVALAGLSGVALLAWASGLAELEPLTIDSRGRLTWPFEHPNHLGAACAVLIPVTLAAAAGARRPAARAAALVALALGTGALLASLSRTAWIAAAIGVVVVAAHGPARRAVAIALPVALLAAAPVAIDRFSTPDAGAGNVRVGIWGDALALIGAHPVTGVGLGRFGDEADPVFAIAGHPRPEHAHDVLLDVGAEAGVLAMAGMLAILVVALVAAHRAARRGTPARRLAGAGVAGGLTALVPVALMDQPLDDVRTAAVVWFALGAAVGLARGAAPRAVGEAGPWRGGQATAPRPRAEGAA